jgi:nitroreductase
MSGEPVSKEELMTLFEAARWAPSSSNRQPWRFIYALQGTENFEKFFSLLDEGNKEWCAKAGVLVVVVAKTTKNDGSPARTYAFDAGAAWENLALQASSMDLVCHGMSGIDFVRAKTELGVPDDYAVQMMIALGHPGRIEDLSERNQAREKPNDRRPLSETVFEGKFPA